MKNFNTFKGLPIIREFFDHGRKRLIANTVSAFFNPFFPSRLKVSGVAASAFVVTHSWANDLTQIDALTQQWLDTERQTSHLIIDWQAKEPVLKQRLTLLSAEKKQLQEILKQSQHSQEDVTIRRTELLQQQSSLEQQQTTLNNKLTLLVNRIEHLSALLPPPLKKAWAQENASLSEVNESSKTLQLVLAKLSSLMDFQKRISVNEGPLSLNAADEVMVKQIYLGMSTAWFVSADGQVKGRGQVKNNQWTWVEDDTIDSNEIRKAIAIFERRQQADFVELPVTLTTMSSADVDQSEGAQ